MNAKTEDVNLSTTQKTLKRPQETNCHGTGPRKRLQEHKSPELSWTVPTTLSAGPPTKPYILEEVELLPRTYNEVILKRGTEPRQRSLRLIWRNSQSRWHIKVTFHGTLPSSEIIAKVAKRREDLQELCNRIDFANLRLLGDTVTELVISHSLDIVDRRQKLQLKESLAVGNQYIPIAGHLSLEIREDPVRVHFPIFDSFNNTPTKDVSEISTVKELGTGVFEAHVDGDEDPFVYKEVDRPLYEPSDTEALEYELHTLERFRSTKSIVHLVAAVISTNPYQTTDIDKTTATAPVLRGILLEHHPNGTLQDALQSQRRDFPWGRWTQQIADALNHLHQCGITHNDLKPKNIVISKDYDAIVIDVGGRGVTQEWLSPEMRELDDPVSQDTESRRQNDIWALGRMISMMASRSCIDLEKQILETVATGASKEDPFSRISLRDIISKFSGLDSETGSNPPSVRSSK
jgi:serine/threonine protein kinase